MLSEARNRSVNPAVKKGLAGADVFGLRETEQASTLPFALALAPPPSPSPSHPPLALALTLALTLACSPSPRQAGSRSVGRARWRSA